MENKIFAVSFVLAVALNALFFLIFRIQGPKTISITESEVYLMDYSAEDADWKTEADRTHEPSKMQPFFSVPGVYQKIYTRDMRYSVNALKDETRTPEFDPFKDDKKLITRSMDFSPDIQAGKTRWTSRLSSLETVCLDNWIDAEGGKLQVALSEELLKYFHQDIFSREFSGTGLILNKDSDVHIIFFSKNSFSVLTSSREENTDFSRKLTMVFQKSSKHLHYMPDKISGKIFKMSSP